MLTLRYIPYNYRCLFVMVEAEPTTHLCQSYIWVETLAIPISSFKHAV